MCSDSPESRMEDRLARFGLGCYVSRAEPTLCGGGGEGGGGEGGADAGVHQTATIQRRVLPAVRPAGLAQSEAIFTYISNG